MKIALILNTRNGEDEFQVEYDPPHTIEMIKHGIEAAGYEYVFIEADENIIENLKRHKPDMVFNRSEGLRGESRESHIPAILEMMGIPYIGSGPKTLAVCLDKAWTKVFVASHGVKTPTHKLLSCQEDAEKFRPLYPVILKPNIEGSSIGINEDNVVYDREAYLAKIESMFEIYRQPILVEEFIKGREFSVSVLVKPESDIEIFPILEVDFSRMPSSTANVFGQIAKTVYDDLENYICPAIMEDELKKTLIKETERVCKSLGIRDFARLDFRVDDEGVVWFLEINPLPGMDYEIEAKDFSFYTIMAFKAGYDYDSLVSSLIESAKKHNFL
jgi:D-alanine-D-alanine ligase